MAPFSSSRRPTLPRFLLGAYVVALVYGSLYPWSDWHWVGWAAFGFVTEPWPHWWTGFDVAMNVAVYVPLGALAVLTATRGRHPRLAFVLALVAASALSFLMETLQSHLPARVPSRLDWLANTCGAAMGAGFAAWMRVHAWPGWPRWRASGAAAARTDAMGVTLLATWVLLPMHPQRLMFGTADLAGPIASLADSVLALLDGVDFTDSILAPERLLRLGEALRLGADLTVFAEALGAAAAIVVIGLLVREMFPPGWPRAMVTATLVVLASLARTGADSLLAGSGQALAWLSAGAQGGFVLGAVLLALLATAWRRTRLKLAIAALVLNVALTSTFPLDAYHESISGYWQQGAWRNFDGLLQGLAFAWPFAACAWCLFRLSRARRRERA